MVHSDPNELPMLSLPSLVVTEYLHSMSMGSDPRRGSEAALAAVEVTKKLGAGEW